ncbi:MAG: tryptophan synthase subunit alpha [Candidatus Omnitrophica bacterium]|nr:tryptophan synthase subunit alpha [Candidatus Omnitrophota bacterium]
MEKKFKELKEKKKKAFIVFITAGFPSLDITRRLVLELEKNGADLIELGVPFSDPLADGPVIQNSSQRSLKAGTTLDKILSLVKSLRKHTQIPICLMSYYNPIFCFGKKRFLSLARSFGVDGIIIPDLPPEEDKDFISACQRSKIDTIFFLSPTTALKRIPFINRMTRGFIYYVSLTGVTGARNRLPTDLIKRLKIIKKHTDKPVCVGFGVSTPEHVKQVFSIVDGVVVGSAIIKKIQDNAGSPGLVKKIGRFVKYLSSA